MFKIGEFAKIAQVSGRLLRYYNEIGLFTPEQIDPDSGYRFYSAAQLPRLNRILALRDLGLTLEQIGRMLDGDVSADEIRGMLFMRKAQIEQNLQAEIERLNQVELRLKQIEQEGHPWTADVVLKEVPALPIMACSLRDIENPVMWSVISAVMSRALPAPAQKSPRLGLPIFVLYSVPFTEATSSMDVGYQLNDPWPTSLALTAQAHNKPATNYQLTAST